MFLSKAVAVILFAFGVQNLAQAGQSPVTPETPMDPCLESTCRDVPLRENLNTIKIPSKSLNTPYVALRGVLGGFAQGSGIAGGVQLTTADAIPHLQLRANFLTATSLDQRFDLEAVVNTNSNRNHVDVWFSYMKRQNDFFGIGPTTPGIAKTSFQTDQRSYQASFHRDITTHLKGGVFTQTMNTHSDLGLKKDPAITAGFSGLPNQPSAQWIPGFLSSTQILSYGGFMEYDARNKSVDLTRGFDLYGRVASNDGMKDHAAFSDYGWLETEFDARGYIPLGSSRTSLALRSRGQFKRTKGGSQIPFYDLSFLGGREYVRGYHSYRFRGNDLMLFSTELRRTVYKKTDHRGVDAFAFADSGQVWGDERSTVDTSIPAGPHFRSSSWRSGTGGGIEYRHSRSLAARLEVGRSNEGARVYVSISRGF